MGRMAADKEIIDYKNKFRRDIGQLIRSADICLPEGNRPSGEGTGSTPLAAGNRPAF